MTAARDPRTTVIRTLVVDDDYRVASVHAAFVEKIEGFGVVGRAHTCAQALDAAAELRPDLVLMDVYLPDGDGLDVVRRLIEEQPHPDVMVITAARDLRTVRTAMQLGAIHYLVKPFGFAALSERLTAYRRLVLRLADLPDDADQSAVDELFGMLRGLPAGSSRPSKGHSAPTLELVRNAVTAAQAPLSAADVAAQVGISRATAQRYLTYLERYHVVRLHLRYGSTGRPEHLYSPT